MKNYRSRYAGLIVFLILAWILPVTAFASDAADPDRPASLTVECTHDGAPLSGVAFDLYKVADIDASGGFTVTDAFSEYSVSLGRQTVEEWRALAQTLAPYAIRDGIPPLRQGSTDSDGRLSVTALSTGMYLVYGQRYKSGDFVYIPEPFLVSLPSLNGQDEWYYDVVANCKGIGYEDPPETVMVRTLKVWDDEGHETNRPEAVEVQLLRDGGVYDTVTLNAEGNWRFVWQELPGDCEWSVVEKAVPENYSLQVVKEGVTFVLTNSYTPAFTAVRVRKVWDDQGHENMRPAQIEVLLLEDGQVYDTAVLNGSNDWEYTWSNLEEGRDWSVKEASVPAGYSSAVTQEGGVFTLTNTYSPPPPPAIPKIPQTGQLWWPIPVLAGAGLVCYLIGFLLRKARKKRYE